MTPKETGLDEFYVNQISYLLHRLEEIEAQIKFWENKRKKLRDSK